MKNFFENIPEQIKRLGIIIVFIAPMFIAVRSIFIPEDFGELGHYRLSAIYDNIKTEMQYAGQDVCADCHDSIFEDKMNGFHKNLSCEVCHGPAVKHVEYPDSIIPDAPRLRLYCVLCHQYLPARPTGFPQIDEASHNPVKPCITCHNPHEPKTPEVPKQCAACHAEISRSKSVSVHAYIECTICHVTDDRHKTNPRTFLPTVPKERSFCGQCHSLEEKVDEVIPRININEHEVRYLCWQCHYPHYPEVK